MKPLIKKGFDYPVPIAKVDKAGITTTGGECDNELKDVLLEFRMYNTENPLWQKSTPNWVYSMNYDLRIIRSDNTNTVFLEE